MGHYRIDFEDRSQEQIDFDEKMAETLTEREKEKIDERNTKWAEIDWNIFSPGDLVCIPHPVKNFSFKYNGYGFNLTEYKKEYKLSDLAEWLKYATRDFKKEREEKEALIKKAAKLCQDKKTGLFKVVRVDNHYEEKRVYRQDLYFAIVGTRSKTFGPIDAENFILVTRPEKRTT